ncbi:MAG: CoA transferase [Dehalococcoidia bacterium]|nr:MAG: CoA transferase [Dehalococcoidia bacterium]
MGPLEGIKVLDLSRHSPGRYTSMMMADLGAEVITVETPRTADSPSLSFMFTDDTWFRYVGMNCSKKSIAVNLKYDKGKEILHRLVERSDVLIEAFRPGASKRLGMDYDMLSRRNPRLIYCSVTGYGQESPYVNRASHDINVAAMTGILGACGAREGSPIHVIFPQISDLSANCQAISSILAALYAREKTGRGQYIDVAITDGMVYFNWVMNIRYLLSGHIADRSVLPTGSDQAWLNTYRAKDGKYVAISCLEPPLWANLCRLVGREDFIPSQFEPIEKQKEMYDVLCELFAAKDRDEWVRLLDEADVASAPVYRVDEALSDPHVKAHGLVVEVDHPKMGTIRLLQSPYRLSDTPARPRARPPLYGEHTLEILQDVIGACEEEIKGLREEGVIE